MVIDAQATVVFNQNAPISTGQIFNTIDAGPPTSSVSALPTFSPATFLVNWSGQDDPSGSGIATYNVYVSDDDGPFTLWQSATTQTSATYTGQDGHTYAFYSVATDNVGNVLPTPSSAQASTTVSTTSITAVVINQDISALYNAAGQPTAGVQRSMVDDIVYTFDEPVNILSPSDDPNVFTIAVAPGWTGTVPTLSWAPVAGTNNTEWAVTFSGNGVVNGSIDNGAYTITVNHPSAITAVSDATVLLLQPTGIDSATQSFYRLFGDINGDEIVNASDNLLFKQALTSYNAIFDLNGDGVVNAADNLRFKQALTVNFSGFTRTI
jgi:Dockerin type I domain